MSDNGEWSTHHDSQDVDFERTTPPRDFIEDENHHQQSDYHDEQHSRQPHQSDYSHDDSQSQSSAASNKGNIVHVSHMHVGVDDQLLTEHMSSSGKVLKVVIMLDPHTRESRGFGFVTFEQPQEADDAIEKLHLSQILGKTITVARARRQRPREPTPGQYIGPPKYDKSMSAPYQRPQRPRYQPYPREYSSYDRYERYPPRYASYQRPYNYRYGDQNNRSYPPPPPRDYREYGPPPRDYYGGSGYKPYPPRPYKPYRPMPPRDRYDYRPPRDEYSRGPPRNYQQRDYDSRPPRDDFDRRPPRNFPPRDDFRGPPREDFRVPSRDDFRGPPRNDFRGPPRDNFRGPPRDDYNAPPREGFNGPPPADFPASPRDY
ncbi:RNA-binding domain-containing protein [Wallemia mellicola CBS 633.66]|uniref:RNA-binding domain-containing protein n=1 Tax=Wallemia mellicola (strain ATCC MYA-4683 / CBS 633.66) TaxID=671144 RepID=I4YHN0_WALMC|nr:RNA-binding domain-containing protein [Wallemia mellicola CBS 633.66]EIM23472.1 RNA-binding domain-containing protein [Wallemia mellicola CBS 633.66]|eukprot:XP_006956151.1 RNA-binding domain-containing protein [Wallemia mellicola CBS 633.66]